MSRVTLTTQCGQHLMRHAADAALGAVLRETDTLLCACERLELRCAGVSVSAEPRPRGSGRRAMKICNLVGKIGHYDVLRVFRAGVLPLVERKVDTFGESWCLYSVHGNVRVNAALTTSLFRGAAGSRGVLRLVEHAFLPETVQRVSVHMFVATGHLGCPVATDNAVLARGIAGARADGGARAWRCVSDDVLEEMSMYRHFRLTQLDGAWLRGLGVRAAVESVRLSVARTGFVSVFVSLGAEDDLTVTAGCEDAFQPLLDFVLGVVAAHA